MWEDCAQRLRLVRIRTSDGTAGRDRPPSNVYSRRQHSGWAPGALGQRRPGGSHTCPECPRDPGDTHVCLVALLGAPHLALRWGCARSASRSRGPCPCPRPGSASPCARGWAISGAGAGGAGAPTDGPVSLPCRLLPTEELSGTFPTAAVGLCADGALGVEPSFYFAT